MALDRVLHGGEPLRTMEEVMAMRINEAQTAMQAEVDRLNAAFHAKGYVKARAQVWLGRGNEGMTIYVDERPEGFGFYPTGSDLAAMLAEVHDRIAALPDARAYDADFSAPLFLMSEQHAKGDQHA